MVKKYVISKIDLIIFIFFIIAPLPVVSAAEESFPFTDVNPDASYAAALAEQYEIGLIGGMGDGTFRPQERVAYAMLAQILCNVTDGYDPADWTSREAYFNPDVIETWYESPAGFVSQYDLIETENWTDTVVCSDTIRAFYRLGLRTEMIGEEELSSYGIDPSEIYDSEKDLKNAEIWAFSKGILREGEYKPDAPVTRAELSELLARVWPLMDDHRKITRICLIDSSEITSIRIQNGNTGESVRYSDPQIISEAVGYLNDFRCSVKQPLRPGGGYGYNLSLYTRDSEWIYSFTFFDAIQGMEMYRPQTDMFGQIYESTEIVFPEDWFDTMIQRER